MAERLADKYEEAKEKQEDIMNRWVQTTLRFVTEDWLLYRSLRVWWNRGGRKRHPGLLEDRASEILFVGARWWFVSTTSGPDWASLLLRNTMRDQRKEESKVLSP